MFWDHLTLPNIGNSIFDLQISIFTIRNWAISAYRYNNEFIAKNVLDFRPIPGEQKGCVDLQETTGGLVWAVQ